MKKLILALAFIPGLVWAQDASTVLLPPALKTPIVNAKAGLGATVGPTTFLFLGNIEYQVDRFLAVGPMIQYGTSKDVSLVIPTLAGRLIIPASFTKSGKFPGVEVSLQAGFGPIWRDIAGFTFLDFDYHAGLNAEVYVYRGLAVGLGGLVNITTSPVDSAIGSLYGAVSYHY